MKYSSGSITISAYFLKALLHFSSERGIDTAAVFSNTQINPCVLEEDQGQISLYAFNQIWNEIVSRLKDPFLGLHFGEALGSLVEGHFLFVLIKNCQTVEKALQELLRYHSLLTDIIKPSIKVSLQKVCIQLEYSYDRMTVTNQLSDSIISFLLAVLKGITNNSFVLDTIMINHSAPRDTSEYEIILGTKPVFNSPETCIVFNSSELKRALPVPDNQFAVFLKGFAEEQQARLNNLESFSWKLENFLEASIIEGRDYSLNTAARIFHFSPRQMQIKLKYEGSSYQVILDKSRMNIAKQYLMRENILLCDIAFLLGFSEQSSFNHAFKRWTGLTPREYILKNKTK